jgi:hypothetical protein
MKEFNQKIEKIKANFPNPNSDEAFEENGNIQFLLPDETLLDYRLQLSKPKHLHIIVQVLHRSVDG